MTDNISWQTIEYLHTEKTTDWYWIVAIITVSITLISIIFGNLIFGILIIVSSFTLTLFASRKPESMEVEISNTGVRVGKTIYSYAHLSSFWIETREANPRVLLKSNKIFMPFVVIFLEDMDHEKIRTTLSQYLPEEEHREPLLEKLLIYFGF